MIISNPDPDPTDQVMADPDPSPSGQVMADPDPDRNKVCDPGGSGSATLVKEKKI